MFQLPGRGLKLSVRFATVWASTSNAQKMRPLLPQSSVAIAVHRAERSAISVAFRRRASGIFSKCDLPDAIDTYPRPNRSLGPLVGQLWQYLILA